MYLPLFNDLISKQVVYHRPDSTSAASLLEQFDSLAEVDLPSDDNVIDISNPVLCVYLPTVLDLFRAYAEEDSPAIAELQPIVRSYRHYFVRFIHFPPSPFLLTDGVVYA